MNNSIDNDISALMDDELPPDARDELYQHLKADAVLIEKWSRYHIIRDTLTNQLPDTLSLDLADRVRAAIDAEPTHFLPQQHRSLPASVEAEAPPRPSRPGWFLPAAAAATVAAVAILGFQLDRGGESGAMMAGTTTRPMISPTTVAVDRPSDVPLAPPQWLRGQAPQSEAELARHLAQGATPAARDAADRYLVEHNGVAAGSGMYNVFPYARMVSQDVTGAR